MGTAQGDNGELPADTEGPAMLQHRDSRDYVVGEVFAHGGMGAILTATDRTLGRVVAMKMLLDGKDAAPEQQKRFLHEARILGKLEHPNIVPVYELALNECDETYYTMKLVRGRTLAELLDEAGGRLDAARAGAIFRKVCEGIAYAHSRGILHRDIKPQNVMMGEFGEVLIMDWGLALEMHRSIETQKTTSSQASKRESGMTQNGAFVGTPGYAAPEQRIRGAVDERSDIYALGILLHRLLGLPVPTTGKRVAMRGLGAIARKAASEKRDSRYRHVRELLDDLDRFEGGFLPSAEPPTPFSKVSRFVARHRREFSSGTAALGVLLIFSVGFLLRLSASQRGELRALDALRASAPSFYDEARTALEHRRPDDALERVRAAIALDPTRPDFHLLEGRLLQILGNYADAERALERTLKLAPDSHEAARALALGKEAAGMKTDDDAGAGELARKMIADERVLDALNVVMRHAQHPGFDEGWKGYLAGNLEMTGDLKGLALVINRTELSSLVPIAWVPLQRLFLFYVPINDLAPIERMPLKDLSVYLRGLPDVAPVRNLPLESLVLSGAGLTDISVLRALPLREVTFTARSVADLSPLEGKPLETLRMWEARVSDLAFLKGMPLRNLVLTNDTKLTSLAGLRGFALEQLSISRSKVKDLSPLSGMPLRELVISGTPARDLSPLASLPLEKLDLADCAGITDLGPLKKLSHLTDLILPEHLPVPDFLRSMPSLRRISYKRVGSTTNWTAAYSVADFWKRYGVGR